MGRKAKTDSDSRMVIEAGGGTLAYVHLRGDVWQFRADIDGARIRKSCCTTDRTAALAAGRAFLTAAKTRLDAGRSARPTTFAEVAAAYVKAEVGEPSSWKDLDRRERTHRSDALRIIDNYLLPFFHEHARNIPIDAIKPKHTECYESWRQTRRDALIAAADAEHANRCAVKKARWESSPRIRAANPDLAAYMPKRGGGHIRKEVTGSAINHEIAVLHRIWKFAESPPARLVADGSLPRIKQSKIGMQVAKKGFTEAEVAMIRKVAAKRLDVAKKAAYVRFLEVRGVKNPRSFRIAHMPPSEKRKAWESDPTAWSRWLLCQAIDLLKGTGMRPSTLEKIERWQVLNQDTGGPADDTADYTPAPDPDPDHPYDEPDGYAEYVAAVEGVKASPQGADWLDSLSSCLAPPPTTEPSDLTPAGTPWYNLIGSTFKGKKGEKREWEIVADAEASAAINDLLWRLPKDKHTPIMPVSGHALNKALKKVLRECGLEYAPDGTPHSLYDFRHYYITSQITRGAVTLIQLAHNTMTSNAMIEKYYDKYKPRTTHGIMSGRDALRGAK